MIFGKVGINEKADDFKGMTKAKFKKRFGHLAFKFSPYTLDEVWEEIKKNRKK